MRSSRRARNSRKTPRPMARMFWIGLGLLSCLRAENTVAQEPPVAPAMPPIPKLDPVMPESASLYEKISLTEAVRRALARNPTAVVAYQEMKRAEALMVQARSGSMPSLTANATLLRLDADRILAGVDKDGNPTTRIIGAKNQQSANLVLSVPLIAPQRWVQWSQGEANIETAKASGEAVRRTLAVAVARAYLAVISQKRQVDINARSVAADRSHFDYTHTRFAGGIGNRVDEVRAAQQLAFDQAQLSASYASLAHAREALGVLLGEDKPIDVLDDITLSHATPDFETAANRRQDVRAAKQRAMVADKVRKESWADFTPTLSGQFQPFYQHPNTLTQPETGWQAMLVLSFPLVEGGIRIGQKREREALVAEARAQYDGLLRQTRSDLRVAGEEIRRADEAMRSAQAAADLAHQALDLANLAYHAGATTNIEVTDAERRARDADSAVVIAEDNVRQARLDLLVAAGQFP
jgi:outer membrane protein TolC